MKLCIEITDSQDHLYTIRRLEEPSLKEEENIDDASDIKAVAYNYIEVKDKICELAESNEDIHNFIADEYLIKNGKIGRYAILRPFRHKFGALIKGGRGIKGSLAVE